MHQLKGSAGNLRLNSLLERAKKAEDFLKDKEMEKVRELTKEMKDIMDL